MIDRTAIVEAVSQRLGKFEITPNDEKDNTVAEVMWVILDYAIKEGLIEPILEAAGFWELLEAAEKADSSNLKGEGRLRGMVLFDLIDAATEALDEIDNTCYSDCEIRTQENETLCELCPRYAIITRLKAAISRAKGNS